MKNQIPSFILITIGILFSGQAFVFAGGGSLDVVVENKTKERIYFSSFIIYNDWDERFEEKTQFDEFGPSYPIAPGDTKIVKWGESTSSIKLSGSGFKICIMSPDGDANAIKHFCSDTIKIENIPPFRLGDYRIYIQFTLGEMSYYGNKPSSVTYGTATITVRDAQ